MRRRLAAPLIALIAALGSSGCGAQHWAKVTDATTTATDVVLSASDVATAGSDAAAAAEAAGESPDVVAATGAGAAINAVAPQLPPPWNALAPLIAAGIVTFATGGKEGSP